VYDNVTTLGKVFNFLVLLGAVVIVAGLYVWAGEATNWKEQCETQVKKLEGELSACRTAKKKAEDERDKALEDAKTWRTLADDTIKEKGKADIENAALQQRIKDQDANLKQLQDSLRTLTGQLNSLQADLKTVTTQKDKLRDDLIKAEERVRKAEDELAGAREELQNARDMLKDTKGQLTSAAQLNERYEQIIGPESRRLIAQTKTVVQKIDGRVRRADNRSGLVLISVGVADGVTEGMAFEVIRSHANQYVGRIHVTKADDTQAVCRIDKNFTKMAIMEGDDVSTRQPE
jgi:predicted  nucleic acid-binding Zn-ribbon protein